LDCCGVVLWLEGSVTCDHLEDCDAQGPKINLLIVPTS
jgi:hypothetical protein